MGRVIRMGRKVKHEIFLIRRSFVRAITKRQREAKRESIQREILNIKDSLKGTHMSDEDRIRLVVEMAHLKCQKRML